MLSLSSGASLGGPKCAGYLSELVSNKPCFPKFSDGYFQGHLAVIIGITRAGSATALVLKGKCRPRWVPPSFLAHSILTDRVIPALIREAPLVPLQTPSILFFPLGQVNSGIKCSYLQHVTCTSLKGTVFCSCVSHKQQIFVERMDLYLLLWFKLLFPESPLEMQICFLGEAAC